MGLDQYVTNKYDGLVGWVTKVGRVINITWSLTSDKLLTSDRVVGCQHSDMGAKMSEWK
jgi:hypothetical protein